MRSWDVRVLLLWILVVIGGASASREARADDERVSGFTTNSVGEMSGHVTDNDGDPLVGIEVFVTTAAGERKTTTDKKGRYKIDLGKEEGQKFVFVRAVARINGQSLETTELDGEEVFEIRESEKPKVMPRPKQGTNLIPEYSDEARDADVWARAWLLLDIDASGQVTRMKLLHAPGYGLDRIATLAAGNLEFEPAKSPSGKPVPALVLWTYEWPSYYWLLSNKFTPNAVPEAVAGMACASEPSNTKRLRDCTKVDISKQHELPWLPAMRTTGRVLLSSGKVVERDYWYQDYLGWALAGGGAAVVATSIYLIVGADEIDREAEREVDPVREAQKHDQADTRRFGGYVLSAVGLGMIGVGTAKLIIHTDGAKEASATVAWRF
jgi:hypothetical protein